MATPCWDFFGASVRGPGHIRHNLPNQDSFLIRKHIWGALAVVSDGVGACPTSEYGSREVCRAVDCAARKWNEMNGSMSALVVEIQRKWMELIKPFEPGKSMATCLFAFFPADGRILLGMLGDGLVVVLKTDGSCVELCEDKGDGFSNQTSALSDRTSIRQWRMASFVQDECCAVLLCTDGVADDLISEKRADFVRYMNVQARDAALQSATREIRTMLEQWPVPKHSDDKTLVFSFRRQEKEI